MGTRGREKRVEPAWGREKRVEPAWGREKRVEPRGFIAPNPRKVRGVHELRGNSASLVGYYYYSRLYTERESRYLPDSDSSNFLNIFSNWYNPYQITFYSCEFNIPGVIAVHTFLQQLKISLSR